MPDRDCVCGGAGWDGCPGETTRMSGLDHLRSALQADADRPLGFRGALITDRTTAVLAELTPRERSLVLAAQSKPLQLERSRSLILDQLEIPHARTIA